MAQYMRRLRDIKAILARHKKELAGKFSVKKIGIFGSWVRDEQKKKSDIDLLVELKEPVSLLGIVRLENHISELLGAKVDLVPKKDIRPELKEIILNEAVYI